jgi:glycosyltransferase involved in cell wall biosynthesis
VDGKREKMKKVKVLHTIRQGLIGGGETHVLDLVKHLNKERFESFVLSFTDGPMIDRLNELGIRNHVIHTTKPFDFRVWKPIRALLAKEQFDLVHAHGTRAASNLLRPTKACHLPLVYTVHGWSFHDDQPTLIKQLRIQSEKFISDRTSLNISVSKSNQDTGKRNFGTYNSTVVNNGIDLSKFDPTNGRKNLREEWGISSDKVLVCCTMRMTKQKDPLGMLRGFAMAVKECPSLHLLMVGDGELKEESIALTKQLKITDHVTFEKFRTDIPNILYSSDIYCLPSLWEGLPIGLLEAMGMRKAVIATKVDGSKEIINNGTNGILIDPKNSQQLAASLIKLGSSEETRRKLAEEALKTVTANYNVIHMTSSIENIYSSLLSVKS